MSMSSSTLRLNQNCVLRRNVQTQPYGRCSVCELPLRGCHAWRASGLSFGIILLSLALMTVPSGAFEQALVLGIIALVLVEGRANHRRTDQLIASEHSLRDQSRRLERAVDAATGELREANQALARSNLELLETDRLRESILANVAHDLRTPLTAIQGAADNLIDGIAGPLGADQREYVAIVRDHAVRLSATVNEVLRVAREQTALVELHTALTNVSDLVADVARGLETLARERGVRLEVQTSPAEAPVDADKLRRVLEILLSNAIRFTWQEDEIVLTTGQSEEAVEVLVRDTGIGIGAEDLPRIFERFYRGRSDRSGTGLGLAIARSLVRLHGGEISVQSEPGRGSEFRVLLPRGQAHPRRSLPVLGAAS